MFDFEKYQYNYILVAPENWDQAWNNLTQVERWAFSELNRIQSRYDYLSTLEDISSTVYLEEIEPPIDYAEFWESQQ